MYSDHEIGDKICHVSTPDEFLGTIVSAPNEEGHVFVSLKDRAGILAFPQEELESWDGDYQADPDIFQVFYEEEDDVEELRAKLDQANEELRSLVWVKEIIRAAGEAELGKEAEELRSGVESLIADAATMENAYGDEYEVVLVGDLQELLDRVDARDCLAGNK